VVTTNGSNAWSYSSVKTVNGNTLFGPGNVSVGTITGVIVSNGVAGGGSSGAVSITENHHVQEITNASYSFVAKDRGVWSNLNCSTSAAMTIGSVDDGFTYYLRNISDSIAYIINSSGLIDGKDTLTLTKDNWAMIVCDGTDCWSS